MHILVINGSLRKESFNRKLAVAAQGVMPDGVTSELAELHGIPLYDGDVEAAGLPESVVAFRQKIAAADGVLIAMPEYNFSISGVLKNAIDWASRPPAQPFHSKPVAMLGTGGMSGTLRGQMHLRQVFLYLQSYPMGRPEFMLAHASKQFDAEGQMMDEKAVEQLTKFVEAFVAWVGKMSA